MKEADQLTAELEKMKTQLTTCDTQTRELQKMYDVAVVEAQVQRTLCEEQLKTLKK
jgi:septation ring formation regulator EzrA